MKIFNRLSIDFPGTLAGQFRPVIVCAILAISVSIIGADPLTASDNASYSRGGYVLPHDIQKQGFAFAGIQVPFNHQEVSLRVLDQLNYLLMDRRALLMEWFDRIALYGPTIRKTLSEESVPEDLIYLAVVVSDLQPSSRTRLGGVGWWSLVSPKEKKNQPQNQWTSTSEWDDRRDLVISTRIASGVLKTLVRRYSNTDWLLAMCAYADGSDKIDEVLKKNPKFSYWDLVLPSYSEALIPRLIALKIIDTHRSFYRVDVTPLPPLAYDYLDRVKLLKDLPLHVVAKWCGTVPRAMWELNPGVDPYLGFVPKANKTHPTGFPLRVPKGSGPKVKQLLVTEGFLGG
jgi:membrane-bound lytic murein transglycosylase D